MEIVMHVVGVGHVGKTLSEVTSAKQFGGKLGGPIDIAETIPDNSEVVLVKGNRLRKVGIPEDRVAIGRAFYAPAEKRIFDDLHVSAETSTFNTLANTVFKSVASDFDLG